MLLYAVLQLKCFLEVTRDLVSRYPSSGGLCPLIYRDHHVDDRSRRGTRRRRSRVPPEVAVAAAVPAAASPPSPVPVCRRRAPCRRPRCSPGVATSRGRRSMPVTRRSRGGSPAGTHPPQLPGKHRPSSPREARGGQEERLYTRNRDPSKRL